MAEFQPTVDVPESEGVPLWRIRIRLFANNAHGLWLRLLGHPSAVAGLAVLVVILTVTVLAPHVAPYDPEKQDLFNRLAPPAWSGGSTAHLLGTDQLGRDLLSRIIYGGRISILVGFITTVISVVLGTLLGAAAGYFRGRFDALFSRFADFLMAFPFLIWAIGAMSVLGPGFANLVLALSFKGWVEFFRLVRGEVMAEKTKEYVEAARALGRSETTIILTEILPNIIHSVLVLATLRIGYFVVMEATLSFLGLGVGEATWGKMIDNGRDQMLNAWWIATFPGLALVALVLSINLLGEGLRDILDPRLQVNE